MRWGLEYLSSVFCWPSLRQFPAVGCGDLHPVSKHVIYMLQQAVPYSHTGLLVRNATYISYSLFLPAIRRWSLIEDTAGSSLSFSPSESLCSGTLYCTSSYFRLMWYFFCSLGAMVLQCVVTRSYFWATNYSRWAIWIHMFPPLKDTKTKILHALLLFTPAKVKPIGRMGHWVCGVGVQPCDIHEWWCMEERWHRFYWYLFHVLFILSGLEPFAVQASAVLSNFFT